MSATNESARWAEALAFARACDLEDLDAARAVYDTTIGTGYGLSLRIAGLLVVLVDQHATQLDVDPADVWASLARRTHVDRP